MMAAAQRNANGPTARLIPVTIIAHNAGHTAVDNQQYSHFNDQQRKRRLGQQL